MSVHDFNRQMEWSIESSSEKMFEDFYYKAFGSDLLEVEQVTDITLQRKGIDKVLHLKNGDTVYVDEKKRRKDYGDILLEVWSVKEKSVKGWVWSETKVTDYIIYAFMNSKRVFMLPFQLLKMAFNRCKNQWLAKYSIPPAHTIRNGVKYTTENIAVPKEVLMSELKREMEKTL